MGGWLKMFLDRLMVWLILMDCQFMDIFHPFTSENDRKKNR